MIDPHDMMCQEFVEVLTEHLDATLGAHDRARLEAHLTVCDDCREYLAQFQQTLVLTGRADSGTLAPSLRDELRSVFRARSDESDV